MDLHGILKLKMPSLERCEVRSAGDPCPYCQEPLSGETIMRKRRSAAENAHVSRAKAKANGTKMGRPKTRDDGHILQLRDRGHSIRAIAHACGCSAAAVQRAIKAKRREVVK